MANKKSKVEDKKKQVEERTLEESRAQFKEEGYKDQPQDLSEGTVTAPKGYVSPGREKPPGPENPQAGNPSTDKNVGNQMKTYEAPHMVRETGNEARETNKSPRSQFLVTVPHAADECSRVVEAIASMGKNVLSKWDWGCKYGNHTGYGIVEAENEEAAIRMLPEELRAKARAVKVNKFTAEEAAQLRDKR